MSALDDIIARSRTPGTFIERRHFTLSRDKAIEKLREFSLRHPRQYILELIQAAVFSGATYIAVDINPSRLLVAWVGGKSFGADELESIFDYLFADRGEMSTRHLTQLAIGLNALLQRKPKLIRIESGDGSPGSTARMDLDKAGNGDLGIPESGLAGTYILVEYPSSWLPRLQRSGFMQEEGLIETRCLYVPVPVLLNGRAPFGYRASREIHLYGIRHQQSFDMDGRRGVVGLPGQEMGRAGRIGREFRMVVGGVWISSLELPELGGPSDASGGQGALSGVICDDRLRKTADQSDIVQDRRYVEMLHTLQPIATELIREHVRRSYQAPALPRIPDAKGEDEEQPAEPLPEIIAQLGARPGLTLEALGRLPDGEPVFWTRPEDGEELEEAVDPLRFGQVVLKLTAGQARSLELELPELALARLNNNADADFVRRVMERRQMMRLHSVPFQTEDQTGARGTLHLRFHAAGTLPRWGEARPGQTPMLITAGEETLWSGSLPLPLQRTSVVLELDDPTDTPELLLTRAVDLVVPEVWQLLLSERLEGEALPEDEADEGLLAGVLGLSTYTYFVEEDGHLALEIALPPGWGGHATALRSRALTTGDTGIDLDTLARLQGTAAVRALTHPHERDRLDAVEARLGFGHLTLPEDAQRPIVTAWKDRSGWKVGPPPARGAPTIAIRPSFQPGWSQAHSPHPAVSRHLPSGEAPASADWAAGERLLLDTLTAVDELGRWYEVAGECGHSEARCRGMGQLAMLALALAHRPQADVLRTATGGRVSPAAVMGSGAMAIAPLHGPSAIDADTVRVTFDQLRLLEQHGLQPRLSFDDSPEVWRSLSDPDDPRWLIRQEVRAPGLRGWIGLRTPFDGSSGVLIQSLGELIAMPQHDHQAPCHGLLWLSGGSEALSAAQAELLSLARKQLYQRLSQTQQRLDADGRGAAEQYLRAYAAERAPRRTDLSTQEPLTTLRDRLTAALPGDIAQRDIVTVDVDMKPRKRRPIRSERDPAHGGLRLLLNEAHPLIRQALHNPRSTAAELLLLELARQITVWASGREADIDFLEIQRVLIAQRISVVATPAARPRIPEPQAEA